MPTAFVAHALPVSYVDVFTAEPFLGNPVAVVHDGASLADDQMAAFTRWTNLSECAFLLPATAGSGADYRVRIFTPDHELPFAGHPTIGSAHAWLAAGGVPRQPGRIVQECGVGLVELRRIDGRIFFAAPPQRRAGAPIEAAQLARILGALRVPADAVVDHRVLSNGPVFHTLLFDDAARVLALAPDFAALKVSDPHIAVGVVGPYAPGSAGAGAGLAAEVRAFPIAMGIGEDPVTGSLNALIGQWLTAARRLPGAYVVSQGTALGRRGRVYVRHDGDRVWVGGDAIVCVEGTLAG